MWSRVDGELELAERLLPANTPNRAERTLAWDEWQQRCGSEVVRKYIRFRNFSSEADEDIFQETMATAFQEVERGRYQARPGVPFTAYVKGIARNKIREAQRRGRRLPSVPLDDVAFFLPASPAQQPEVAYEKAKQQAVLNDGLEHLTDNRRQVLKRFMRGEGTSEIAAAMQISEDLVRQHKSRGLRRLRQLAVAMNE